jgi:hypothetical protein
MNLNHVGARAKLVPALLILTAGMGSVPLASAQVPKPGPKYFEEKIDLGFRFKAPADWDFIPAQPTDPNGLGSYVAASGPGILFLEAHNSQSWDCTLWIVKLDRRKQLTEAKSSDGKTVQVAAQLGAKTLDQWVQRLPISGWGAPVSTEELKLGKLTGRVLQYRAKEGRTEVGLYAALFPITPEVDVALIFNGAAEDKKWSKSERAFESIAKSFQLVEANALGKMAGPAGTSLRDIKRFELQKTVAATPGWSLYETPNYFLISNNTDKPFLDELMERLEAIRAVYQETYPAELAEELNRLAEAARSKTAPGEGTPKKESLRELELPLLGRQEAPPEPKLEGKPQQGPGRSQATQADTRERSRCSVVRVCKSKDEYVSYGGPPTSAGYWNSRAEELVLFDDKAEGGRGDTWAVLNHEAFHQYIFYFFGELAPHSWYNEGSGDFYSGYEYRNKRFFLEPFDWRVRLIQETLRKNEHEPWTKILRFTQEEYYKPDKVAQNYAQGWAMIYFLRTGKKSAKGWKPAWDKILDTYLRTLVITDDLDQAVDKAFEGIDLPELEKCWRDYTLTL